MVRLPPSRLAINPLLIEWAGYHAGGFAHRDLKSAFVAGHVYPMTMRVVTALRSRVPRGRSTASDRSNRSESLSPGTSELRVAIGAAIKKAQWAISAVTHGVCRPSGDYSARECRSARSNNSLKRRYGSVAQPGRQAWRNACHQGLQQAADIHQVCCVLAGRDVSAVCSL